MPRPTTATTLTPLLALLAATPLATAHFQLTYPNQASGSCDGDSIPSSGGDLTSLPVEAFPVSIQSTHPQSDLLIRFTNSTEEPYEWTDVMPAIMQQGLGDFCLEAVSVGEEWIGMEGTLQVVQKGPDGVLYQCSSVEFVSGANETVGSSCSNSTGARAEVTGEDSEAFFADASEGDGHSHSHDGDEDSDDDDADSTDSGAAGLSERLWEAAMAAGAVAAFIF